MNESESPIDPPTDLVPPVAGPIAAGATSIERIIASAIEQGRPGDELQGLLDLFERLQAKTAEAAYNTAFAAFQAECPPIPRSRTADITTKAGAKYSYCYASLDEIDATALPVLNKHGFSRSFGDTAVAGGAMTISCRLAHVGGHFEERRFSVPVESSAGMSPQQKYGSAATYAKRQAFVNVAGLKVCDTDDDGAGPGDTGPPEVVSAEEAEKIGTMLAATESNLDLFAQWIKKSFGADSVEAIPAANYPRVVAMLEKKLEERAAEKGI
jgi:hypothetical protein